MRFTSVLLGLLLLSSCQKQPQTREAESAAGASAAARSWESVIEGAQVTGKRLAWREFAIGMPLIDVRRAIPDAITFEIVEAAGCGEHMARITHNGADITLQFPDTSGSAQIQSIYARFADGGRDAKEKMTETLHNAVDSLAYYTGPHDPQPNEDQDPTPQYIYEPAPEMAVLLKPDEGLLLSLKECLD